MKKVGQVLFIIGIAILVVWLILLFVPLSVEISDIELVSVVIPGVILFNVGLIIIGIARPSKAIRNGPLVRGKIIHKSGGESWWSRHKTANSAATYFCYTMQYTTADGQQITSKTKTYIDLSKDNPAPVRYNPQKPEQCMIDEDAYVNATFFKEDLAKQDQMNFVNQGQTQMNFDPMQLQAQMMNKGVTTQAAMDIRNTGVQAKGVVLSAQPTGKIVGNNGEMELKIEVTKPDGNQYQTTVRKAIPPIALPYIQAGRVIQVFYKPEDEQNITIGL